MFLHQNYNRGLPAGKAGFSIIEILVAIFVIVVALASIVNMTVLSLRQSLVVRPTLEAQSLTQEALEVVRNFRDGVAWNSDDPANEYDGLGVVAKGIAYRISKSSDNPARWRLSQGQETLGMFTRSIVFEVGRRDGASNLIASGGSADSDTVKATAIVSWLDQGIARQSQLVLYLTNWQQ